MAWNNKIAITFEGTPVQWKAVYDDLGGLTATGPSLYVARRIRKEVREALVETRRQRLLEREPIENAAIELTAIDQDVSDIDTDLTDYPEL